MRTMKQVLRPLAWVLVGVLFALGPSAQDATEEVGEPAPQEVEVPPTLTPEELGQVVEEASRAEATEIVSRDAALSERLRSIFAALDGLRGAQVEVKAGIVVLTGTASTNADVVRAEEIAGALDGVVLVVNEIDVERSMNRRLATSWEQAKGQLRSGVASLPLLGAGLGIVLLAWILARLLRDATFLYRFISQRTLLQNLLRQTVYVAVILGGMLMALRFVDAGSVIGTVVGAAGVVGIALGFAFRNIVENYLAGILLAIRQPFGVRDDVSIDGSVGTVVRMTTSETTLIDADGNHLRLPNAMVFNGKVVNYTRNPLRRFTVSVGVGTDVDLGRAQRIGIEALDRMNGVVDDPDPSARIVELADSSVVLRIHGWVDQRQASYVKAASEAMRLVKVAYDQAGISMPAPAYLVQLEGQEPPVRSGSRTATASPPKPKVVDSGPAPEEVDVSSEEDVTKQIEQEIARTEEGNLLADAGSDG